MIKWIWKRLTHNYCDTCGWTKDDVFVTERYTEAGLIQCNKCFAQYKGGDNGGTN